MIFWLLSFVLLIVVLILTVRKEVNTMAALKDSFDKLSASVDKLTVAVNEAVIVIGTPGEVTAADLDAVTVKTDAGFAALDAVLHPIPPPPPPDV